MRVRQDNVTGQANGRWDGGPKHQPGTSYPTPRHQDPIHQIQILHGPANQRGR
jgi:hypothetical protein